MHRWLFVSILGIVHAAGAWAAPPGDGQESAPGASVDVTVEARYQREDGQWIEFPVSDGDVLRSGNGMRIRVEVLSPSYLHIALVGSSGKAFIVFPANRAQLEQRVPVGGLVEIPPKGQFFTLDDKTGEEAVFVFISDSPLEKPLAVVRTMNEADGDVDAITRWLNRRFPEVHRVAFSHIDDAPLVGVDPTLPLEPEAIVPEAGRQADSGAPSAPARRGPPRASFSVIPRSGVDEMDEVLSGEGSLIPPDLPAR